MPDLHLIAGPNGAGKSTLHDRVISILPFDFVNADHIAAAVWPGDEERHGHDAAALAERARNDKLTKGESFIAETVFSHPSKLDLIQRAPDVGYAVTLHVVVIPEDLCVARVADRVHNGGHSVPEDKIRSRYQRLWPLVASAVRQVSVAHLYDNSRAAEPVRLMATFRNGQITSIDRLPNWLPQELVELT